LLRSFVLWLQEQSACRTRRRVAAPSGRGRHSPQHDEPAFMMNAPSRRARGRTREINRSRTIGKSFLK